MVVISDALTNASSDDGGQTVDKVRNSSMGDLPIGRMLVPELQPMRFVLKDFEVTNTAIGLPLGSEASWIPAVVPGGVHESLLAAGQISHPYYGTAEADLRWVEQRDWWYRTSFDLKQAADIDRPMRLVFHGLDTVVDVWLNELKLGHHENMYRPAEFNVSGLVRQRNELVLRFSPPLAGLEMPNSARELREKLGAMFAQSGRDREEGEASEFIFEDRGKATLRRKPIFSWGWDFAPRLPSIGIWQPAELVFERQAILTGYHVQTLRLDRSAAAADLTVTVVHGVLEELSDLAAVVTLTSPEGRRTSARVAISGEPGECETSVNMGLDEVALWWTHDLGEPSLYELEIVLGHDGDLMHCIADKVGIRTISLDRSADVGAGGQVFRFVLNEEPVFARGAAYLPDSMFIGSLDTDRQRSLIEMASGRWHEHAAHLGRRALRTGLLLSNMRRARSSRLARFHVRMHRLSQ